MKFTLLTLNLGGYKDWSKRRNDIVMALNQTNADIVLLQEVRYDRSISPLNQAEFISSSLTVPYEYSVSDISRFYVPSIGEPYREGLAILSRLPLCNSETLALAKAPDDRHTRIIQSVEVVIDGSSFGLTNVHFSNNRYSTIQLKETIDILDSRNKTNLIAGDFNIFDINNQRSLFEDDYTVSTDITAYTSFPLENATLDYILLPDLLRYVSVKTFEGISDHSGVLATIEFSALSTN